MVGLHITNEEVSSLCLCAVLYAGCVFCLIPKLRRRSGNRTFMSITWEENCVVNSILLNHMFKKLYTFQFCIMYHLHVDGFKKCVCISISDRHNS